MSLIIPELRVIQWDMHDLSRDINPFPKCELAFDIRLH